MEINTERQNSRSLFHCFSCGCLFVEPVTLVCGHTFCKTCVEGGSIFNSVQTVHCKQCGFVQQADTLSVNVLISRILRKWFPNEYELEVKKLEEARRDLLRGNLRKSLVALSGILNNFPNHVLALKLRGDTLAQMGLYSQALQDAEKACEIKPFLPSVFHRKGLLLTTLDRPREAVLSFLRCAAMEPKNTTYRADLLMSLTNLLSNGRLELDDKMPVIKHGELFKGLSTCTQMPTTCPTEPVIVKTPTKPTVGNQKQGRKTCETISPSNKSAIRADYTLLDKRSTRKRPIILDDPSSFTTNDDRSTEPKQQLPTAKYRKLLNNQAVAIDVKPAPTKDLDDLECKICYSLLYRPVTTLCGHTFCRECLQGCLDHRPQCPCCRHELNCANERKRSVSREVEGIEQKFFHLEYAAKERCFMEEKARWIGVGLDEDVAVPIFVGVSMFPGLSYPLHICEPKYRLMIRHCIELGSRMFGVCARDDHVEKGFADYGTMLRIERLNLVPDGRCFIQTNAGRRFHVVSHGMKDGYDTAKVEWLHDEQVKDPDDTKELKLLNIECRKLVELWCSTLTQLQYTCITNAIGPLPHLEDSVLSSPNGPAWVWWALAAVPLQDKVKLIILTMTSLSERLASIRRFLEVILTVKYEDCN